jgi:hypothetical protein
LKHAATVADEGRVDAHGEGLRKMRQRISTKLRFEVFKRDKFTCQYCGRSAPEIVLNVDHINPVSNGGDNDILNLVTSCFECNNGKKDRLLSDSTVIKVQTEQLKNLDERRQQLEMMIEWKQSLVDLEQEAIQKVSAYWSTVAIGFTLSVSGTAKLRDMLRKYSAVEVFEAIDIASGYLSFSGDNAIASTVELAFSKLPGILRNRRMEKNDPAAAVASHAGNIMRKSFYVDYPRLRLATKHAMSEGVDYEEIIEVARKARSMDDFEVSLDLFVDGKRGAM